MEIDIQWKSDLRDQLQRSGIAVDSIPRLAEYARFFLDGGSNINDMLATFSSYRMMHHAAEAQNRFLGTLKARVQESLLQENKLKVSELEIIKRMGFGLSELKRLHLFLDEVSEEARSLAGRERRR